MYAVPRFPQFVRSPALPLGLPSSARCDQPLVSHTPRSLILRNQSYLCSVDVTSRRCSGCCCGAVAWPLVTGNEMLEILSEGELAALPRWARMAFFARCARRAEPIFRGVFELQKAATRVNLPRDYESRQARRRAVTLQRLLPPAVPARPGAAKKQRQLPTIPHLVMGESPKADD